MRSLTFISWYDNQAMYLNNDLIYYGLEGNSYSLLKVLGYECKTLDSLPDTLPKEYTINEHWSWIPPKTLQELEQIRSAVKERERLEKIEYHKRALRELENQ